MGQARRTALITGISGQDGSYLAELLLGKDYEVHGIVRRSSSINTPRLDGVYQPPHTSGQRLFLHYGDITDASMLTNLLRDVQPDEVYNLAAQSHVRVSFDIPDYTGNVDALGTMRMLEAVRASGCGARFYQASTSELFGSTPPPQNERSPFHPRSPYAVAKLYAHWAVVNYREAYGLHASNGILFNHECVPAHTPVMLRRKGHIDIVPIADIVPHGTDTENRERHTTDGADFEVWDGTDWARCEARTATWHDETITEIRGRGAIVAATDDHVLFLDGGNREVPSAEVTAGERLWLGEQPGNDSSTVLTTEAAERIGILVSEGAIVDGHMRVPKRILNASDDVKLAFLRAYDHGNAVKTGNSTEEFHSFRAASPVLAAGLIWLARTVLGREASVRPQNGGRDYLIDLSPGTRTDSDGAQLSAPEDEIREVVKVPYKGWMFDLATTSKRFAAGIGLAVIHNSPRRGETFVTRKITRAVARIAAGIQSTVYMGNLNARRDWGYAPEYVEGMWLMLRQDKPDDYVLATGEAASVRDFLEVAFGHADLDWEKYVKHDSRHERPAEADSLHGDPSKAKKVLGWEAKTHWRNLAKLMVNADLQLLDDQLSGRSVREEHI